MLNFSAAKVRYEPYPLAILRPALDPRHYEQLCSSFPDISLFGTIPKYDYKLSLSEKFNPENYHAFLGRSEAWNRFHSWIKSDDFIRKTVEFLSTINIDLQLAEALGTPALRLRRALQEVGRGKLPKRGMTLRSRFEFSVLKADGGEVAPHTDTPKKIITLVLSMIRDGDWETGYGGGLDVNGRGTKPTLSTGPTALFRGTKSKSSRPFHLFPTSASYSSRHSIRSIPCAR